MTIFIFLYSSTMFHNKSIPKFEENENRNKHNHFIKVTIDMIVSSMIWYKSAFDVNKRLTFICS